MEEHNLTEFNSNLATLERIDKLLRFSADAHFNNDLSSYFKFLRNLRKEIIVKMRGDTYEEIKKDINKQFEELKSINNLFVSNPIDNRLSIVFEKKLNHFEDSLRDFADLKGMLLRDSFEDDGL